MPARFRARESSMLQVMGRALSRLVGASGSRDPAAVPTAIKEEYRDFDDACLTQKADSRIEPFLRLLYDNGLIDCGGNPREAEEKTQLKIQHFVYFAQACFGLGFDYRHTLYTHGPHSPTLTNDYHRIRDIRDMSPGRPGGWPEEGKFLDFAKAHNDVDWLEIAGTLVYLRKAYGIPIDDLIECADRIRYKFPEAQIKGVCKYLQDVGFVK